MTPEEVLGKLGPGRLGPANWALANWAPVNWAPVFYIFVLDIFCQQLGEYMSVEFVYWYWIYSANNWGIYAIWRVSVLPSGAGLGNMQFLEYVHIF